MQDRQNDIAEILLLKALDYDRQGDVYNAVKLYKRVIRMSPDWSAPFSFLSLIYKKRCEWRPSLHYSQKAIEHNPFDEKAWYNLAISATALKKWEMAREAWQQLGFRLRKHKTVAKANAVIPIRINPKTKPEIIWATKIDPARAIIQSIPQPSSEHQYQDIILFDNEPTGKQVINNRALFVYDALQIIKRSNLTTFVTFLKMADNSDVQILDKLCFERNIGFDNWSNAYRTTEGALADTSFPEYYVVEQLKETEMQTVIMVALAAKKEKVVKEILDNWKVITLKDYGEVHRIIS